MINASNVFNQTFQDIYSAFNEKIRRYLARIADETEADDLTQEVFIKVSRGLKDFQGKSSLSIWIYKIATNTALDRLRALSLEKGTVIVQGGNEEEESENSYLWAEDHKPSLETALIRKEMNDCIRGIAEGLQENYKTVLVLSDFEELSSGEIADILGISSDAVKIRLHRGLEIRQSACQTPCRSKRVRTDLCARKTEAKRLRRFWGDDESKGRIQGCC